MVTNIAAGCLISNDVKSEVYYLCWSDGAKLASWRVIGKLYLTMAK